jgi:predicted lipoprotein
MVDPLSFTVNVLSILQTCTLTVQAIDHLIKRYRNAPAKLMALQSESRLVSTSLVTVQGLFHKNQRLAKSLDQRQDLKHTIDTTLTGCMAIYRLLEKDLQKLVMTDDGKVDWRKRSYLLFNDELIESYLNQIRGHLQGLNLLLSCLQL